MEYKWIIGGLGVAFGGTFGGPIGAMIGGVLGRQLGGGMDHATDLSQWSLPVHHPFCDLHVPSGYDKFHGEYYYNDHHVPDCPDFDGDWLF